MTVEVNRKRESWLRGALVASIAFLILVLAFATYAFVRWLPVAPESDLLGGGTLAASMAAAAGALILAILTYRLAEATKGLQDATVTLADLQRVQLERTAPQPRVVDGVFMAGPSPQLQVVLRNDGPSDVRVTAIEFVEYEPGYSIGPDAEPEFEGPEPTVGGHVPIERWKKDGEVGPLHLGAHKQRVVFSGPVTDADGERAMFFDVTVHFSEGPSARGRVDVARPPEGSDS